MPDHLDAPLVPLRDVQALADVGLESKGARATEDRARQLIAARVTAVPTVSSVPRRKRPGRLSRRTAGLLGVGLVLVGGTAIAATAPWSPQLGDARRGHPTVATTPVPANQTAALAVLRREQTDADRGPRVTAALKMLTPEAADGLRLDSVRLLAERPDGAMMLVPSERVFKGPRRGDPATLDQLCLLQSTDFARINGKRVRIPSMGVTCGSTRDIKVGRMMSGAQWDGRIGVSGVVPDGVATVEVPLSGGPTLRAKVVNNSYYLDRAAPRGRYNRNDIRWLDRDGAVIEWRRWRRPDLLAPGDR